MKYELNIYELGQLLSKVTSTYNVDVLTKLKLSGGWMTITGAAQVVSVPENRVVLKGNNIITLKIKDTGYEGSSLKITGAKGGSFNIDLAPTKYREFGNSGLSLNKVKINNNECKLRIDEDMIFTIRNASVEDIDNILKSI
ncbi:UDP-N-acetylglucosamine pyrophosphorylase [Clostridium sp. AL.422]|uniref:UDP-N-acetylglucosamine pyrophosphorylase n=1 Tax=Clostridium TaxID=1485 RepID=UPI00293DB5ED|nr:MULTISPECIES: UDP-N-acetylglucosamine pyrophosphorylase [unclassified Clostridium]MDV4149647.1 UDP-N-acetylglucosamine pyrophosphorylase [Clostridium sp. AL.422]